VLFAQLHFIFVAFSILICSFIRAVARSYWTITKYDAVLRRATHGLPSISKQVRLLRVFQQIEARLSEVK